jgi:hypothetical protein
MKFKDLNETTVYAYRRGPRGVAEKIMVVDASTLYTTKFRESGYVPAREGQRANMSSTYSRRSVGVLVRTVRNNSEHLVMPAQIVGTWEEVSKQEEKDKQQRLAADKAMDDFRRQNALDAQRLRELMLAHPEFWPSTPYVDTWKSTQEIRTSLLIKILEALPDANV